MSKYILIIIFIIFIVIILFLNNCIENFSNDNIHPMNKYFDSVNVITVPKRKKYMIELMNKLKINVKIIDATLIKNINYNELIKNNFVTKSYYKNKNKGRIACHYSQIKLIKEFLNSNDETIFIFEDDIDKNLPDNYKEIISKSMDDIPNDWDIVFFGRCYDNCNKMKKINKNLYKVYSPKCRHAYGLTRKGAEKILKYSVPMINNGDIMYAENINNGNIIAYAANPSIFSQNRYELGSTIGNDIKLYERFINTLKKIIKIIIPTNNDIKYYPPLCSIW
jgi:GR25 family glycosyltransferase involved in LPS biosynthesis